MNEPKKTLRILVIEDEGLISMLIEDMLAEMGHEVAAVASHLDEALSAAQALDFDFAVLDVNLGGVASYPVADMLLARSIPFAFSTGYGAAGVEHRYAGMPTLQKPFSYEALSEAISNAVRAKGTPASRAGGAS